MYKDLVFKKNIKGKEIGLCHSLYTIKTKLLAIRTYDKASRRGIRIGGYLLSPCEPLKEENNNSKNGGK